MANLLDEKMKPVSLKTVKHAIKAIKNAEPVLATNEDAEEMISEVFGKDMQRYYIRKHGENIDYITMQQFVQGVKKGTINYEEGKQIVIPYTDPINNKTYNLPFNFGTTQTFEKEDGTAFTGLGLIAEYGLPADDIQFDDVEPSNPDEMCKDSGNNRWQYSNLRQWLNISGKNWFVKQHTYDAKPTKPNPKTTTGFLDCLPEEFVNACVKVKNVTKYWPENGNATLDTTYDKFFPLSMSQINCKCTNTDIGLNDETEGRYWDYWRNKQGSNKYWSGNDAGNSGLNDTNSRIVYNIEKHSTASDWWLRSAYLGTSYSVWFVLDTGCIYANDAVNNRRVVPACVIG